MDKPSDTITNATIGGAVASVLIGLLSAFFPDVVARIPPGVEAGVAVIVAAIVGYATREKTLRERILTEQVEDL